MLSEKSFRLQPMRLVALLDAAFGLYRRHFLAAVGIAALLQIPVSLLSILPNILFLDGTAGAVNELPAETLGAVYFLGLGLTYFIVFLQYFLITGVATLALASAFSAAYFGEKIGILEAYRRAWPAMPRFFLVLVLLGLLALALLTWTLIPCLGWVTGPGALVAISMAVLPFAAPIALLEKHDSAFGVIFRSWDLVRRRFWWVLGLVGIMYLLNLALAGPAAVFALLFTLPSEALTGALEQNLIHASIQTFISLLASILYQPIQVAVIMLAYFDLRARTEGIDLFLNEAEKTPTVQMVAEMPTVKHNNSVLTRREAGYFILITLAIAFLYVVTVALVVLALMA